ncbi:MAG: histidine kinase, partial [Candidatus Accumulibacter phosphatis]|nr:histidine kinase [Candidatus Accumulibacter phosphatis]
MSVASALVAGNDPRSALAEEALAQALARTGASHATGVLLFLTPDFARHAQQTVSAVARAAQCTEVAGGIAA